MNAIRRITSKTSDSDSDSEANIPIPKWISPNKKNTLEHLCKIR